MTPVVRWVHGQWFALLPSSEGRWHVWHGCRDARHAREVVEQWSWMRSVWALDGGRSD